MAKSIKYIFYKGSSLTIDINGKRVCYTFTEETKFNSFDEVIALIERESYTCASCRYDGKDFYCTYNGADVTKEDIRARAEGRIYSKFLKK